MKKFTKVLFIIVGILTAVGITFIIAGSVMGGMDIVEDNILNNRFSIGINFDDFDNDINGMSSVTEEGAEFVKDEVNSLDMSAKYGEYEIQMWDGDSYFIESTKGADRVKYSLDNGELKIKVSGKYSIFKKENIKAKIYVPKDTMLDSVVLNIGAGTLKCDKLMAEKLNVKVGAGEGSFNAIEAKNVDFNVGAGEGKIQNSKLVQCRFEVGVGEIDVEANITGDVDVDCGIGEVNMNILNYYTDFNYDLTTGIGDIKIADKKYSGMGNGIVSTNGADRTMKIKNGMGDVKVEFIN